MGRSIVVLHVVGGADIGWGWRDGSAEARTTALESALARYELDPGPDGRATLDGLLRPPLGSTFPGLPLVTATERLALKADDEVRLVLLATAQGRDLGGVDVARLWQRLVAAGAITLAGSARVDVEVCEVEMFGAGPFHAAATLNLAQVPGDAEVYATFGSGAKQLNAATLLAALGHPGFAGAVFVGIGAEIVVPDKRVDQLTVLAWLVRAGAFDSAAALAATMTDERADCRTAALTLIARRAAMGHVHVTCETHDAACPVLKRIPAAPEAYLAFAGVVGAWAEDPWGPLSLRCWLEVRLKCSLRSLTPQQRAKLLTPQQRAKLFAKGARLKVPELLEAVKRTSPWSTEGRVTTALEILDPGNEAAHRYEGTLASARVFTLVREIQPDGWGLFNTLRSVGVGVWPRGDGFVLTHCVGNQERGPTGGWPFADALGPKGAVVKDSRPHRVVLVASTDGQPGSRPGPATGATVNLAEGVAARWKSPTGSEDPVSSDIVEVTLGTDTTRAMADRVALAVRRVKTGFDEVVVSVGPGDARMALGALLGAARGAQVRAAVLSAVVLRQEGASTGVDTAIRTSVGVLGHDDVLRRAAAELVRRFALAGAQRLLGAGSEHLAPAAASARELRDEFAKLSPENQAAVHLRVAGKIGEFDSARAVVLAFAAIDSAGWRQGPATATKSPAERALKDVTDWRHDALHSPTHADLPESGLLADTLDRLTVCFSGRPDRAVVDMVTGWLELIDQLADPSSNQS